MKREQMAPRLPIRRARVSAAWRVIILFVLLSILPWPMSVSAAAAAPDAAAPADGKKAPLSTGDIPTVSEAVLLALNSSAAVKAAKHQVTEAQIDEAAVKASLGLRVDATLSEQVLDAAELSGGGELDPLSGTLSVRRSLAPGPEAAINLKQASLRVDKARAALGQTMQNTVIATYEAYRQLELALLRQEVQTRVVRNAKSRWDIARQQQNNGTLTQAEVDEARLSHQEAANRHRAADRLLDVASLRLAQLLGIDLSAFDFEELPIPSLEETLAKIRDRSPAFWPETDPPLGSSLGELVAEAHRQRTEVLQAQMDVELAAANAEKSELAGRPRISATARYAVSDQAVASLSLDSDWVLQGATDVIQSLSGDPPSPYTQGGWDVGFQVSVNLWDSHTTALGVRKAESGLARAQLGLSDAQKGVELDVLHRHAEALAARDNLRLAGERVMLAELNLNTEEKRHSLGIGTDLQVDVLTARLLQSVVDALSSRFDYEIALLRLAHSAGFEDLQRLGETIQRR